MCSCCSSSIKQVHPIVVIILHALSLSSSPCFRAVGGRKNIYSDLRECSGLVRSPHPLARPPRSPAWETYLSCPDCPKLLVTLGLRNPKEPRNIPILQPLTPQANRLSLNWSGRVEAFRTLTIGSFQGLETSGLGFLVQRQEVLSPI